MEIITIEPKAFKEIIDQIGILSNYIQSTQANKERNEDNEWVDNYEVCTFLKISERTLQRLRTNGEISFSRIRGRTYYKLSEIRRMLDDKLIRSKKEYLDDLINHHSQTRKQKGKKRKIISITINIEKPQNSISGIMWLSHFKLRLLFCFLIFYFR